MYCYIYECNDKLGTIEHVAIFVHKQSHPADSISILSAISAYTICNRILFISWNIFHHIRY
jgi:hypothetical protein